MNGAEVVERLLEEPGSRMVETHGSWVVITGDRVLKIKKPVKWSFLDYRTLDKRLAACREEVAVNQALAPGIYLGVRPFLERDGELVLGERGDTEGAVEFCVEMRRFAEEDTLAERLAAGVVEHSDLVAVAVLLASFHERAQRCVRDAPVDAFRERIDNDLEDLEQVTVPGGVGPLAAFGAGLIARCRDEIEARAAAGLIRDGHGDLRADHVVLETPLLIVDRIEFDPALRQVDVADDLSFLLMDLESRGGKWAADALAQEYAAAGGNLASRELMAGFAWRRALVRAKVALLARKEQRAAELLELAHRFAWRSRINGITVVCGPPASGKSTVANAIADLADTEVVSSDITRKTLLGIEHHERAPSSAYTPEMDARVYEELARRASAEAPLILDATYRRADQREALEAAVGQPVTWIWCDPPAEVRAARAARREQDPTRISDADAGVSNRLAAQFEALEHAWVVRLGSAAETHELLNEVAARLDGAAS